MKKKSELESILKGDNLCFLPLGGSGEIGMNLNLYSYRGKFIMVDCGMTFHEGFGVNLLTPDPGFIVDRKEDLLGLIVTHAHEDHIGAIPYLWQYLECPIYATPFTLTLIQNKLSEANLLKLAKLHTVDLEHTIKLDPFSIEFIHVTHSIPEPNMLAIHTPKGTILHTGDWKFDDAPVIGQPSDKEKLAALQEKKVLAVIGDSTNVLETGPAGSELEVQKTLIECFKQHPDGRVVVACFASNMARIQSCAVAAKETGRKAALVGRSLLQMEDAARKAGYLAELDDFITIEEAMKLPRHKCLLICTGSQGEDRSALSRIANKSHPMIKLDKGDVVVFSSRVIPGNEKAISDLKNCLALQDVDIVGNRQMPVHVSGHPGQDDLKELYKLVRPISVIPVHGEARHLIAHSKLARTVGVQNSVVIKNGDVVNIMKDGLEVVGEIPTGVLAIDGKELVPINDRLMLDRKAASINGVLCITVGLKGKGHYTVHISQVGVFYTPDAETHQEYKKDIVNVLKRAINKNKLNLQSNSSKEVIRKEISYYVKNKYGKRPLVVIHIA